jgi:ribonuclease P/MRP protein subunit RPP1
LDDVMVRFMAERGIAIELNFSGLLNSYGFGRAQVLGRMRQNIMLARKYGAPLIITSGALDVFGLRTPQDLLSVCLSIGMDAGHAKKVLEECPSMLVKKSNDRKNPDVLLKGLEVASWDASEDACKKTDRKRMYGWY